MNIDNIKNELNNKIRSLNYDKLSPYEKGFYEGRISYAKNIEEINTIKNELENKGIDLSDIDFQNINDVKKSELDNRKEVAIENLDGKNLTKEQIDEYTTIINSLDSIDKINEVEKIINLKISITELINKNIMLTDNEKKEYISRINEINVRDYNSNNIINTILDEIEKTNKKYESIKDIFKEVNQDEELTVDLKNFLIKNIKECYDKKDIKTLKALLEKYNIFANDIKYDDISDKINNDYKSEFVKQIIDRINDDEELTDDMRNFLIKDVLENAEKNNFKAIKDLLENHGIFLNDLDFDKFINEENKQQEPEETIQEMKKRLRDKVNNNNFLSKEEKDNFISKIDDTTTKHDLENIEKEINDYINNKNKNKEEDKITKRHKIVKSVKTFISKHKKAIIIGLAITALGVTVAPYIIPSLMNINSALWWNLGGLQSEGIAKIAQGVLHGVNNILSIPVKLNPFSSLTFNAGTGEWLLNSASINAGVRAASLLNVIGATIGYTGVTVGLAKSLKKAYNKLTKFIKNRKEEKKNKANINNDSNKYKYASDIKEKIKENYDYLKSKRQEKKERKTNNTKNDNKISEKKQNYINFIENINKINNSEALSKKTIKTIVKKINSCNDENDLKLLNSNLDIIEQIKQDYIDGLEGFKESKDINQEDYNKVVSIISDFKYLFDVINFINDFEEMLHKKLYKKEENVENIFSKTRDKIKIKINNTFKKPLNNILINELNKTSDNNLENLNIKIEQIIINIKKIDNIIEKNNLKNSYSYTCEKYFDELSKCNSIDELEKCVEQNLNNFTDISFNKENSKKTK